VANDIRRVVRRSEAGVAGEEFDALLARLEQAVMALGRELDGRAGKAA
jgi:hypothetical protein